MFGLPRSALANEQKPTQSKNETPYATLLLVLEGRKPNGRKWDIGKGADPIICSENGCYASKGLRNKAHHFKNRQQLILSAIRAGDCRNKLSCVYRRIPVRGGAIMVQPIDIDAVAHDFLERRAITIDESCVAKKNHLACSQGVHTPHYSLWVVPEEVARFGGLRALDYALFKGIYESKRRFMRDFLSKTRRDLPQIVKAFYELVLKDTIPRHCMYEREVMKEAMIIAGLLERNKPRWNAVYDRYLAPQLDQDLVKKITTSPKHFWAMHKSLSKLQKYANAQRRENGNQPELLRLQPGSQGKTLEIGWAIRSRAGAIIDKCRRGHI